MFEDPNFILTTAIVWLLAFILITAIVVVAYLYELKRARSFERMKKQLKIDGILSEWESDNKLLLSLEKFTFGFWVLSLFSTFLIPAFLEGNNQLEDTTLKTMLLSMLAFFTVTNIVIKRLLYYKLTNATYDDDK